MIRDLAMIFIGFVILVFAIALMREPYVTVTVSPELETAAQRIIKEHTR